MTCCQPPLALAYLVALLARRHDIAIHPAGALDRATPPDDFYLYRPGEVLVPVAQAELFVATAARLAIRHVAPDGEPEPGDLVRRYLIGANADLDTVLDRLVRAAPEPLRVTPNHVLLTCPRWHLSPDGEPGVAAASFPAADRGTDGGVTVAVIDSGLPVGYTANTLLDPVIADTDELESWTYDGTNPVLTFPQGHGSFVAGVVRQHAPGARVRSYLAADQDGVSDEWALGRQIDLALDGGAAVINLSLGTPSRHDEALLGLSRLAADASGDQGPIVVAAAGNMDTDRRFWPAAAPWAISVAAVEQTKGGGHPTRASFSDYGHWVDTCALGVDVVSSYEARPYRTFDGRLRYFDGAAVWSGTSFAAPRVSAAVAVLRAADPTLSRRDVLDRLRDAPGAIEIAAIGVYVP